MKLSKSIEGYKLAKISSGYSPETIRRYDFNFGLLVSFLNDKEIETVVPNDLQSFMAHVSSLNYSSATLHSFWKSIRSLFGWAESELGITRPDLNLKPPKYTTKAIHPFTQDEIKLLIKACKKDTLGKNRPTAKRDEALILFMLDTGLRVGEICRIKINQVNMENGEIFTIPYRSGAKSRARTVYLGTVARRSLWRYLADREDIRNDDFLFLTYRNQPMTRLTILHLLVRLGKRANIPNVHPHRFRHTFAIEYLRNGGDVFTLQRLLGHSTLEMVNHYLDIVKADIETAHRKASPVDRWKL